MTDSGAAMSQLCIAVSRVRQYSDVEPAVVNGLGARRGAAAGHGGVR